MPSLTQRFQLFKTVADLHNQGRVILSETEKAAIERETMNLVRKSVLNKRAEKAPPGFEGVLEALSTAPDADSAYELIVEYLKEQGALGDEKSEKGIGDVDLPGEPEIFKGKGSESSESKEDEHEEHESPKKEHEEHESDEEESKEDKAPKAPFDKKPGMDKPEGLEKPEMGSKPPKPEISVPKDLVKEREALRVRAQEMEVKPGIADLQKDKREFGKEITSEEMGMEPQQGTPMSNVTVEQPSNVRAQKVQGSSEPTSPTPPAAGEVTGCSTKTSEEEIAEKSAVPSLRAKKVRVHTTPSGTIVASHVDLGPVFHAVPAASVRADAEKLRLLANRIYGKVVYEGFAKAAAFCKAKMIRTAGVDDDIVLNHVEEVGPEKEGVTEDAESVNRQKPEGESDSVLPGGEVVTQEKPETVTARRLAVAHAALVKINRRKAKDILDDAENVIDDVKPSKPSMDTKDGAETNSTEQHGTPDDGVLDGGSDVIRNAQKHFQKLYASRTAKAVAAEKEAFIRRFTRAMRLAATRMLLNHEEHPFKAAAVDVLADNSGDIEFSDGQRYTGMDVVAAVELTELIASEGHKAFLDSLLTKAADLMQKDDRYLMDAESDLAKLAPVSVTSRISSSKRSASQSRSVSKRRAAVEGNFEVTHGAPATGPETSKTANMREVLGGGTALGRRLGRLVRE